MSPKKPKPPKNSSQLLWLIPFITTEIFPQKVEKNISSWKKYLLLKSEWHTFMWVKWNTEQKVKIPETETSTFSRKTKPFLSFTFFLPTIEILSLGWKAIYHFAKDWQSKIQILYTFPLALVLQFCLHIRTYFIISLYDPSNSHDWNVSVYLILRYCPEQFKLVQDFRCPWGDLLSGKQEWTKGMKIELGKHGILKEE